MDTARTNVCESRALPALLSFDDWVSWARGANLFLKAEDMKEAGQVMQCVEIDQLGFKAVEHAAAFGIERDRAYLSALDLFRATGLTTIELLNSEGHTRSTYKAKADTRGILHAVPTTVKSFQVKQTWECINGKKTMWHDGTVIITDVNDSLQPHENWLSNGSGDGWTRFIPLSRLADAGAMPGILFPHEGSQRDQCDDAGSEEAD